MSTELVSGNGKISRRNALKYLGFAFGSAALNTLGCQNSQSEANSIESYEFSDGSREYLKKFYLGIDWKDTSS